MKNDTFKRLMAVFAVVFLGANLYMGAQLIEAVGRLNLSGGSYYGGDIDEHYLAQRLAEEFAQQQNKLFARSEVTFLRFDPERLACEYEVTATPYEYQEGSSAQMIIGEQTLPMAWGNYALTARVMLPVEAYLGEYQITMKTGGTYRSEGMVNDGFPAQLSGVSELFGYMQGHGVDNTLTLQLKVDKSLLPFGDAWASGRVYVMKGEQVIYDQPMEDGVMDDSLGYVLDVGQTLEVYAELTGKSGLRYRYPLDGYRRSETFGIESVWPENVVEFITAEGKSATVYTD